MFSNPESNVDQLGLMPGSKVADLGAGIGFYSIPLAKAIGPNGKVYAVDIQKDLLAKLQTHAHEHHVHNIELVAGDLETPGGTHIKEGTIDFALAANILFQVPEKHLFLQEAKRILRANGRLAIIDWADSFGGIGPHQYEVVTELKAKELAVREGFTFERRLGVGDHHYGLIFKK